MANLTEEQALVQDALRNITIPDLARIAKAYNVVITSQMNKRMIATAMAKDKRIFNMIFRLIKGETHADATTEKMEVDNLTNNEKKKILDFLKAGLDSENLSTIDIESTETGFKLICEIDIYEFNNWISRQIF